VSGQQMARQGDGYGGQTEQWIHKVYP
jgi:hypothetical protein